MKVFVAILILSLIGVTLAKFDITKLCSNQNLGTLLPHPEQCSDYIVCEPNAVVKSCGAGLHFDAQHKVCNWPQFAKCQLPTEEEDKPNTSEDTQTLIAIDVETGKVVNPMKDYDPAYVVCRHFGAYFLPHPKFCNSYYLCAYGHMHQLKCGQDTMWNFQKQQCEISFKAECYAKTKEEQNLILSLENECASNTGTTSDGKTTNTFHPTGSYHTATATAPTVASGTTSDGQTTNTFHPTGSYHTATSTAPTVASGTTSDGQTTNTFHPTGSYHTATVTVPTVASGITSDGQTTNTFQSTGSIHSATATKPTSAITSSIFETTTDGHTTNTFQSTGSIHSATATSSTAAIGSSSTLPTTQAPTKASSKNPNSSNPFFLECPSKQQSYIAHPKDCSKYYMCIMGMPVLTHCPMGLFWDAKRMSCDIPQNVHCFY